jgi:hypothetical protein
MHDDGSPDSKRILPAERYRNRDGQNLIRWERKTVGNRIEVYSFEDLRLSMRLQAAPDKHSGRKLGFRIVLPASSPDLQDKKPYSESSKYSGAGRIPRDSPDEQSTGSSCASI